MCIRDSSECARQNRRTLEFLATFAGPFLTAFADGDPSTRGWEQVLQRCVPGAAGRSHVTVEGAGHFLQEDKGPELGALIARFVRDNPL